MFTLNNDNGNRMNDFLYKKIGGLGDPEWVLRHCLNKLVNSPCFINKMERFYEEGYVAGALNWSIQKWSDEVGYEFDVEPYDGYMAYVGGDEHGYGENYEYKSFHDERMFIECLGDALEWYVNKYPDKRAEIDNLKLLFKIE